MSTNTAKQYFLLLGGKTGHIVIRTYSYYYVIIAVLISTLTRSLELTLQYINFAREPVYIIANATTVSGGDNNYVISLLDEVEEVLGDRTVVTAEDVEKLTYMEQVCPW